MKRKLVKHGDTTLMVSLPSKWIRKNELEKGDSVEVNEKGKNLIIDLEPSKFKTEAYVKISSLAESSIRVILANLYRMGYDKIKIDFPNKNALKIIEEIVRNNLIGFEVIDSKNNTCVIENITEPSKEQFDNIFSKVLLNIDSMFEIIEEFFKGKKQDFKSADRRIQQFDNFCRRVISNKVDSHNQLKWAFHSSLIHAQRELYHLLENIENRKIKIKKETYLFEKCKDIYETLKQAYKKQDISLLEKIHKIERESRNKGYKLLKQSQEPVIIYFLLSAIRNFYLASSPLFGLFAKSSINE